MAVIPNLPVWERERLDHLCASATGMDLHTEIVERALDIPETVFKVMPVKTVICPKMWWWVSNAQQPFVNLWITKPKFLPKSTRANGTSVMCGV